ncbi:hypothetical protein A2875_05435 [Candidatus Gottesmanbacteria bacterium RIFCSPHIGHO2_01_FULL_46_14]|uniref:Addiction module toxin RelE n=2 Tax=Candidatus Gottesmaniibacteriota TaxID=1752720 RepID=A0A1F5ZJX5_9BACT|nr:MAG: hypothetical protein A2875_05435 [Candidatus Gottesmanbacteria bacterium RIFCSPHIGHO2_01_FULL_46_14]OGG28592.1 MAG: hypothetical protein A2971_01730 [Candidatus Gottesmanbacteria bacterium RIFCSPLOWO2_01_FULL_46_21]
MIVKYSPSFLHTTKKIDVRIRKSLKQKLEIFYKNPNDSVLKNHVLRDAYEGYRSINITADWRAIYKEVQIGEDTVAYFVALGTHKQLHGK